MPLSTEPVVIDPMVMDPVSIGPGPEVMGWAGIRVFGWRVAAGVGADCVSRLAVCVLGPLKTAWEIKLQKPTVCQNATPRKNPPIAPDMVARVVPRRVRRARVGIERFAVFGSCWVRAVVPGAAAVLPESRLAGSGKGGGACFVGWS